MFGVDFVKKRNKKYNPKKLDHVFASKNALLNKRWSEVNHLYQFDMQFDVESIKAKLHQYDNMPYHPSYAVIDAYNQQELMIVLKQDLINDPESWEIETASHFYNAETDQVKTYPFSVALPCMSYDDVILGCDAKVNIVDDFKRVRSEAWKGLQDEMIKSWGDIPSGFELIRTDVRMVVEARFKNITCYDRFATYLNYKDNGKLIELLKREELNMVTINTMDGRRVGL